MSENERELLGRIDERTLMIADMLKSMASKESVEVLNSKIDQHISTHITRGSLFASWGGTIVALGIGIAGFMKGSN